VQAETIDFTILSAVLFFFIFFFTKNNFKTRCNYFVENIRNSALLSTAPKKMLIKYFGNNFMLAKILFNIV
jgi:hypothetical protein